MCLCERLSFVMWIHIFSATLHDCDDMVICNYFVGQWITFHIYSLWCLIISPTTFDTLCGEIKVVQNALESTQLYYPKLDPFNGTFAVNRELVRATGGLEHVFLTLTWIHWCPWHSWCRRENIVPKCWTGLRKTTVVKWLSAGFRYNQELIVTRPK